MTMLDMKGKDPGPAPVLGKTCQVQPDSGAVRLIQPSREDLGFCFFSRLFLSVFKAASGDPQKQDWAPLGGGHVKKTHMARKNPPTGPTLDIDKIHRGKLRPREAQDMASGTLRGQEEPGVLGPCPPPRCQAVLAAVIMMAVHMAGSRPCDISGLVDVSWLDPRCPGRQRSKQTQRRAIAASVS